MEPFQDLDVLPSIPSTASHLIPQPWQRSSLPARCRSRSPSAHAWQRSSLPAQNSPSRMTESRPLSYYDPDTSRAKKFFQDALNKPESPLNIFPALSRSSSIHNLHDYINDSYSRTVNSRYSTDDLTPLNDRHQFKSLDRALLAARSSPDIHRERDFYLDMRLAIEDQTNNLNLQYSYNRNRGELTRFNFLDDQFNSHYSSNGDINQRQSYTHPGHLSPTDFNRGFRNTYPTRSSRQGLRRDVRTPSPGFHSPMTSPRNTRGHKCDRKPFINQPKERIRRNINCFEDQQQRFEPQYPANQTMPMYQNKKPSRYVHFKPPSNQHLTQMLATLVVSLGPLCAGLGKGYSSPALASMATLSAQGHHFAISKDQGSWVASLSLLGAFFGSFPAGMSIKWGRKRILCFISLPFAFSWILTVLATNVSMLYAAAILGGICTAIISVVTPVYISEIAHPDIRGCLCSFSKMNSNVGMLLSYLLGAFMNWRQLATVTAIAPACLFLSSLVIPETPSFLLYRGKDTEALDALKWLRGSTVDVSREMTTMKANIATMRRQQQQAKPIHSAPRDILRPLFITCGLMVFQKFSGANAFNFYAVPILSETFVGLNPYRAAVVIAFVQICAGMASSALVDTVGRRPLLIFSNMLMSAALAAFGCYIYLKGLHQNDTYSRQDWKESDWVPLFCILVIEIAYALGVSPISWLYIGELFPLKHRGFGALAASVSYACSFVSVKTFVDLQNWIGLYGTFWFYSTVAATALVFTLIFVPETKGKSLQEMQALEQQKETLI